jgi:dissimilatory sulfite reductase (desulfoviridin) alpha/beta subunit/TusA-related sulfurtransferase
MSELTVEKKVNLDELKRVGIIAQNQKDTFLIRLRTVGGDMNSDELGVITRVAQKYGRGEVHLTTRQGVEIPFVHVDDLEAAREELEENGIVLGVCGPRGRGIVACPGTAVCTSALVETKQLAAELDSAYFRQPAPHKFKIGVSGCPNSCSKPIENDVGVMGGVLPGWEKDACISCRLCVSICPVNAIEEKDSEFVLDEKKCIYCGLCIKNCSTSAWTAKKTGYTLLLGGTLGKKPRLGTRAKELIETKEELLGHVENAFKFYLAHGKKKERFGHTLDRIGIDKAFAEIFREKAGPEGKETAQQPAAGKDGNVLDLLGVCCPMNFVRTKLAIDKIKAGERIEILLDDGEPIINVTRSVKDEGHRVLNVASENGHFRLLVEKRKNG